MAETVMDIDTSSIADYRKFLAIRRLPVYSFSGHSARFPEEYGSIVDGSEKPLRKLSAWIAPKFMFDYQRDITRIAIEKQKFAAFIECGLGKTLILLEFAQHAFKVSGGAVLVISPLMVVGQTLSEAKRFYPDLEITQVRSSGLPEWLENGTGIGITNFEALESDLRPGRLTALIIDESSMLKSHYGKWGTSIINLGRGCEWKLALTGTPAPNDRIEYANHAVFLGACKTVNEFLARYFVNRGQTQERWVLKPHALEPFYRDLSHWCIFLSNPATYGWKDNSENIPPIHVHIHRVGMTRQQHKIVQHTTGGLFAGDLGGIGTRSKMGQIAKGKHNGERIETLKPEFIRELVGQWPDESTIIWCLYNDEQDRMTETFPDAASITGDTPLDERMELIAKFKSGEIKVLISKPKILGFGLNLQIATRQVFSGLQDSYESYWQAVKRSNRVGSKLPLNVHIPITDIEEPMVQSVLSKAKRVQSDTEDQERIFKDHSLEMGANHAIG